MPPLHPVPDLAILVLILPIYQRIMKRIAIGGIVHETNTFVPTLTPLDAFSLTEGR